MQTVGNNATSDLIMVVDDEVDILELVCYNLEESGYRTIRVETGEEALKQVQKTNPDLIILDLMLPAINGLEVCRILKNNLSTADIPIIMLTARGEESDIVTGLELGADDYVTKPFSPRVLLARIKAVIRRPKSVSKDKRKENLTYENISISPGRRQVKVDDIKIELTFTEFEILHLLLRHPGWVFTRNQIVEQVRGDNYPVTDRSVDFQIVGLRKKLGDAGDLIETVRGVGYRIKEL
ncbi:MAG: response regulator transcription factor [Candidatus Marinimicrobia bacterium]|nr:response regulator transcription factor [Candidatus Neomarinimicrobiota bacterium]